MMTDQAGSTTHITQTASKILIVDDQEGIRLLVERILTIDGHHCIQAESGEDALKILDKTKVDLVISDLKMAGISGKELLDEIHLRTPMLPVIILTGYAVVDSAVECIKSGAVDYLSKPFKPAQLRSIVKAAIADSRRRQTAGNWLAALEMEEDRMIGSYRLKEQLGEGAMGVVYLACRTDDPEEKPLALKLLKIVSDEAGNDDTTRRFLRAARATAQIQHENIVHIYDSGIYGKFNTPYLVMEYFTGKPLQYWRDNELSIPFSQRVNILRQVALALDALHHQDIVHRDVKPGNILVDEDFHVKLSDFSIARTPGAQITMTSVIMGSPAYLSPEAFITPSLDNRADIFSLGIVAYELLVGQRPFPGDSLANFARTIPNERPPRPRELAADFPVALEEVLAGMLKKSRELRYQHASEIAEDLAKFLRGELIEPAWKSVLRTITHGLHVDPDWS